MDIRDLPGAEAACAALSAGRAAVLPLPTPLTYGIASRDPAAVNAAKGRPLDQAVAVCLWHDDAWAALVPSLDLDEAARETACGLLRTESVTLLLPLRADAAPPGWAAPATRDGFLLAFGARWEPFLPLMDRYPLLYVSSANTTGRAPAATAPEAAAMFGPGIPVVDGDALRDPAVPHAATTMLRITPDGRVALVRHGAQDAAAGAGTDAYLKKLVAGGVDVLT